MSKIVVFLSFLAISWWLIAAPTQVEAVSQQEEITTQDLGVENPGILPSSPFYFIKDWGRGIKKILTFDPVKKAELELQYTNEVAAEIKKLEEISPSNIKAITKAVTNYQENVERLKSRLEGLKETSQNSNIDKLLDKLVDRSLQHQQLFDDLVSKFENQTQLKEEVKVSQEKINEMISQVPQKFENIDVFKERLETAVENKANGALKELQAVKIINQIKEKLPEQSRGKIQELQNNLIEKFESQAENLNPAIQQEIQQIQNKIQEKNR